MPQRLHHVSHLSSANVQADRLSRFVTRPEPRFPQPVDVAASSGFQLHPNLLQIPVQAKADAAIAEAETTEKLRIPTGGGQSLPAPVRTKMERAFNTSFADVQIHEGSHASTIGAIAYTQGNHIHFAPDKFNPETASGQALLGHELAHVVQQRQGRVKPTTAIHGLPVNDNAHLEAEADRLGQRAALP